MSRLLIILVSLGFLLACKIDNPDKRLKPQIVVTTSILADGIRNLVGDAADVIALMPAGVDPHLYKASARDLDLLLEADIVLYHGLFLEGKMTEIFEKLSLQKDLINVSEEIPHELLIKTGTEAHSVDPHIWFDVKLWSMAMDHAAAELILINPTWEATISANSKLYQDQLTALDHATKLKIADLSKSNQALITAHDAFAYFGKAYGIEVLGLQGLSTLSEPGLRDLTGLVKFIVDRNIKAVFAEQTISPKAIKAVVAGCESQNHTIKLAGPLYTDSLGDLEGEAGTYIGMVQTNVAVIFKSLSQ